MKVVLKRKDFTFKEELFLNRDDIKVWLFRFGTGIEALRIENELGYIIVLPFKGQIIWEAKFRGRILNMYRINKKEPQYSDFYLGAAFGTFFFHCGALRMGVPTVGDDHPLHGELPYADYDEAELVIGNDSRGNFVGIGGIFNYNKGFGPCYEAHPLTKVYSRSSLLDVSIRIDNKSNYPMELMYMAHANFRPVDNARFVQCNPWTPEDMPMRDYTRDHDPGLYTEDFIELQEAFKKDPKLTEIIKPEFLFKPELGFYLNAPRVDKEGWTHLMQILPDGTADFMMYKPCELSRALRWLCKTEDQEGMSLAFPSTSNIEGYTVEKREGRVGELAPRGSFYTSVIIGSLTKDEAEKEEALIADIMR